MEILSYFVSRIKLIFNRIVVETLSNHLLYVCLILVSIGRQQYNIFNVQLRRWSFPKLRHFASGFYCTLIKHNVKWSFTCPSLWTRSTSPRCEERLHFGGLGVDSLTYCPLPNISREKTSLIEIRSQSI